jgi:hypothetical protein
MVEQEVIKINAEQALEGKPTPHYLTGEVEVSKDKHTLRGTVIFPSSDETISSRGHVNVAHEAFAIWNGAHVLATFLGLENPRATRIVDSAFTREIRPDESVDLEIQVPRDIRKMGISRGMLRAIFSQGGIPSSEFKVEYVAKIKP